MKFHIRFLQIAEKEQEWIAFILVGFVVLCIVLKSVRYCFKASQLSVNLAKGCGQCVIDSTCKAKCVKPASLKASMSRITIP